MEPPDDTYCIFLHIVEGIDLNIKDVVRGDYGDNRIVLNATLNSITFEVEGHNTETATIFNSNCIWECQLDEIKKMKMDKRPVKLECSIKSKKNPKAAQKSIGFILLPIRGMQTVSTMRNVQMKLHWHKLGGLRTEWRQYKPQLYLFLMIVKKTLLESGQFETLLDPKKAADISDSVFIRPSETSLMLKSQNGISVQLLENERLIQVGDNEDVDCDVYIVALTFKCAKDLEQLIGGGPPDDNRNASFCFHYDFLGSSSNIQLTLNTSGCYNINEKISLNFKSSLSSLREYFKQIFYIPIALYFNDSIIANYRFEFSKLLPEKLNLQMENLCEISGKFFFETVLDVLSPSEKPSVDYIFSLKWLPSSRISTCEILADEKHLAQRIDLKARGDYETNYFELPPTEHECDAPNDVSKWLSSRGFVSNTEKTIRQTKSDPIIKSHREKELLSTENILSGDETENLTTQVVKELEQWKAQQMKHFLCELKRKEVDYLGKLSSEWEQQRQVLQTKLENKLELCSNLNDTLEHVQQAISEKGLNQLERERAVGQARVELDKRYTIRLIELEEQCRRLKEDMDCKIKMQELECKELQKKKTQLETEKEYHCEQIANLEAEVSEMRKTFLPRSQLAGLFQDLRIQSERYAELEASKNFYKTQWAKLVREVHQLKLDSLNQQEQIMRNGRFNGLEEFLCEEKKALQSGRNELKSVNEDLLNNQQLCNYKE